jgi:hypothetical protein
MVSVQDIQGTKHKCPAQSLSKMQEMQRESSVKAERTSKEQDKAGQ